MLGKFTYYNPTRIYFGENSLEYLRTELDKYGKKILLTYGFSSIKKIGLYDEVVAILKEADKEIVELADPIGKLANAHGNPRWMKSG